MPEKLVLEGVLVLTDEGMHPDGIYLCERGYSGVQYPDCDDLLHPLLLEAIKFTRIVSRDVSVPVRITVEEIDG